MGFYKVMFNQHTDFTTGKIHKKGEVVDSPHPLDELFPNKFQKVSSKGKKLVETELGPEEFLKQRMDQAEGVFVEEVEEEVDTTEESSLDKAKKTDSTKESGPEDVTDKFPLAKKADLKVFFDGEGHSVVDPDDKTNTPLNKKKKLITDKDVNSFIKSHK